MPPRKQPQIPGAVAETTADAPAAVPVVDTGLPNAIDIDARYIRGPVLTKQGYVVPDEAWQKANRAEFEAALKAQG